ncbi:DUF4397 domain-containing protein [Halobellus captivus]|uniref:DUF4397 domain-containing protein n=1 Tax=Halobellus captivus TaxID=2592614 RepID=UPI0011A13C36|nr:DUF4397 domain-containing protein [Halobellus captivus]
MVQPHLSRRRFVGTVTAISTIGLAGCGGGADTGDSGNGQMEESVTPTGAEESTETDAPTTEGEETTTEDGGESEALVRAVHASPDAPNVDIYVDEESVLTDVPFRTVSDYLTLPAEAYQVQITAAGDEETVVFDEEVSLTGGSATSLVALGELEAETFEVRAFEDDVTTVGDGESRVRVLHASPDAPSVDIAVAGEEEPLIAELAFGEASQYATVPADAYTLEVRAAGESDAVASFDVDLESGTGYTAFAMGYLDSSGAPTDEPFDLTVATDTMEGGEMGTATEEGTEMTEETETAEGTTDETTEEATEGMTGEATDETTEEATDETTEGATTPATPTAE